MVVEVEAVEAAVEGAAEAAAEEQVEEELGVPEPAAAEQAVEEPVVQDEEVGFHHLHLGPRQDQSHARNPNPVRRPIHVPIPNHAQTPNALDPNRVLVWDPKHPFDSVACEFMSCFYGIPISFFFMFLWQSLLHEWRT